MNIEDIARIAHEVNRAYCESLGDNSQPTWENAPDWQKESEMAGVVLHLERPDTTPAMSHNAWAEHKLRDGWVYGTVKDPIAKTHPCLVPYGSLPPEHRAKDCIFSGVVAACAKHFEPDRPLWL